MHLVETMAEKPNPVAKLVMPIDETEEAASNLKGRLTVR